MFNVSKAESRSAEIVLDCSPILIDPIWDEFVDPMKLLELYEHPLLQELRSGAPRLGLIRCFLIQQHYYSRHFVQYLCSLIGRVNDTADVESLTHNLLEELGRESAGGLTHGELYVSCMAAVGVRPNDMPVFGSTNDLIQSMTKHCVSANSLDGLAALCLGAEAIVPIIYIPVLEALNTLDFGPAATEFFQIHVEEDEEHALVMHAIMKKLIGNDRHLAIRSKSIGAEMISQRQKMFDAIVRHTDFIDAQYVGGM